MNIVSSDSPVRRKPEVLYSRVEDGVYALDTESGACFAFHGPSAALWDMLGEPLTPETAARRLVALYEIDEERCRGEVAEHFERLHREGLITLVDC